MPTILLLFNILSLVLMMICTNILCNHKVKDKTAKVFIICQVLIINWILCHIMDYTVTDITSKYIFSSIGYISVCSIGTMFLLFSLFYVKSNLVKNKIFHCLIFVPPLILYLLFLTDPFFHLFFKSFEIDKITGGIGFYINTYYSYFLLILGIGNMIYQNIKSFRQKKLQILLISLSAIIPLIVNSLSVIYIVGNGYDFTPLSFTFSSILIFIAIYKFEFISTSPFAVEQLLNTMKDSVLITDAKDKITYFNDSMKTSFCLTNDLLYKNLSYTVERITQTVITEDRNSLKQFFLSNNKEQFSFQTDNNKFYQIGKINVKNKSKKKALVYVFTDITEYRTFTDELCLKNAELSAANEKLIKMNIISKNLAVEKERVRIAQELHDSLGHNLVSVMTLLKLSLINTKEKDTNIRQALDLSENLLTDIRNCVSGIKETTELGISGKIQNLIDNLGTIGDCIELTIIGDEKSYHSFAGETIYSVVREAITNSLHNGKADRINVILKFHHNDIKGYIFDNGKGCEEIHMSHGLNGMEEKINSMGGRIKFISSPDDGFKISFTLPVEEKLI